MPESFTSPCCCVPIPGTQAPDLAPYVVSLNNLYGLVGIAPDGGVSVRTSGNTIYIGANGSAGLGTVTSVNASSSNTNLVVTGGPVTTTGTFAFSLAGALNSISGLVTAADKMIYTTALNTYAVADLSPFARTLLDDAAAINARATLGLVIGTNVQAWSADLDSFVTNASWAGSALTLGGNLSVGSDFSVGGDSTFTGNIDANNITAVGNVTGSFFVGNGSNLTNLDAGDISAGTLAVARGGTGLASYTTGDLIYASAGTTLSKLADVGAGAYLRSGGVGAVPVWSSITLPNSLAVGDILYASTTGIVNRLADVATGNVLLAGGVNTAPAYGKVTSSHVNNTIPTMVGGANSDISSFGNDIVFLGNPAFTSEAEFQGIVRDGTSFEGNAGDILTSTGTGVSWTNQISCLTIRVDGMVSLEGTITAAGSTGAKTINKQCGTVRFAIGASTLIITNSLALAASTRALATPCSVDATLKSVVAVVTDGFITLTSNAAATAETEVYWELRTIS